MKRVLILNLLLVLGQSAYAQDAPNPQQEIERHPGDIDAAVKHLGVMLQDRFRMYIFAEFDAGRAGRPNESTCYAATRILALERMGKISAHSPVVKSAFTHEFLAARADPTRLHEALALYERYAVANTDDPYWRLIRARCARLMDLPETLELYEQVADDMTGVAPDDELRRAWDANREEFSLPAYTKEAWRKQTTTFVYDAKGPDVPGSLSIPASPLPLLDIAGAVGSDAAAWESTLDDLSNASPKNLDQFYGEAKKFGELPWLNGRGFLNTEQALNTHLLSKPDVDLSALREFQEAGYVKATAKATDSPNPLALFRRYPWSVSAQSLLLKSAQQHVFQGEPQAAFRSFKDVLRHAEAKELREQAQVGLWVSLAQFAEPDAVAQAFVGLNAQATWPWYGKREKAAVIKAALVKEVVEQAPSPTLASLKQHTVRLPPAPPGASNQSVFSIDMQREGDRLLVSSDGMLLMYNAANPGKPVWNHTRRVQISYGYKGAPGGKQVFPLLGQEHVVARWAGNRVSDSPVVSVRRTDGGVVSVADPHGPQSRYLYKTIGSPTAADGNVFAVQLQQPYLSLYGHVEWRGWGDVSLSCFGTRGLKHRWTRVYEIAQTNGTPSLRRFKAVLPQVSEGAVFFCTNDGHVIRADARDGEVEWIHFFRPETGDNYSQPASPRCLGSRPIVTDDKVICMPKFTGALFALDKATGRRLWRTPMLRGHEALGVHGKNLVVVSANAVYAVDLDTGKLRWGRKIADAYVDGFQLPRSQMIGSSIHCGTKNTLYRFDAKSGALQESRDWAMGSEVPMSFHIAGSDLYMVSDLPLKDESFERRLVQYHTVIHPAGGHQEHPGPIDLQNGSKLIWRECMLVCIKDGKLVWTRFVSNDKVYQSRFSDKDGKISMSWSGASAVHDSATGRLMTMQRSRAPKGIEIGSK